MLRRIPYTTHGRSARTSLAESRKRRRRVEEVLGRSKRRSPADLSEMFIGASTHTYAGPALLLTIADKPGPTIIQALSNIFICPLSTPGIDPQMDNGDYPPSTNYPLSKPVCCPQPWGVQPGPWREAGHRMRPASPWWLTQLGPGLDIVDVAYHTTNSISIYCCASRAAPPPGAPARHGQGPHHGPHAPRASAHAPRQLGRGPALSPRPALGRRRGAMPCAGQPRALLGTALAHRLPPPFSAALRALGRHARPGLRWGGPAVRTQALKEYFGDDAGMESALTCLFLWRRQWQMQLKAVALAGQRYTCSIRRWLRAMGNA